MCNPNSPEMSHRFLIGLLPFGVLCTVLLMASIGWTQKAEGNDQSPEGERTYVGMEQCTECHEDQTRSFTSSIHGQEGFRMRSDKACETCHGPGSAHVEAGGDKQLIQRLPVLTAKESSAVCLQCHESGNRILWNGSMHESRDVACITCHSIHSAKPETRLLKTENLVDTCANCHLQIKAQIQRTSHHPIREGLISCVNCHNPHGSDTPKLLKASSVNELCWSCHTEKRGPWLWEHPPVRENCLNCHNPHGSNHPKLTVAKRPWLCQACHMDTRHPGSLYDGSAASLASNREGLSRSCQNCHLQIHGSNHPSGWVFQR